MESITPELVSTGEKRDARGRRVFPPEHRAAMMAAFAGSGLTQREFAEREGINVGTFVKWLSRARQREQKHTFAEVTAVAARSSSPLEVVLPNGLVVRGSDVGQLIALAEGLRRC